MTGDISFGVQNVAGNEQFNGVVIIQLKISK
jgi:hypothetical protein